MKHCYLVFLLMVSTCFGGGVSLPPGLASGSVLSNDFSQPLWVDVNRAASNATAVCTLGGAATGPASNNVLGTSVVGGSNVADGTISGPDITNALALAGTT